MSRASVSKVRAREERRRLEEEGKDDGTNLGLLSLTGSYEKLRGRVNDLDLTDDGSRIGGNEETVEMVDDELVSAWRGQEEGGRDVSASSFALLPSLPFSCLSLLSLPSFTLSRHSSRLTVGSERSPDDL